MQSSVVAPGVTAGARLNLIESLASGLPAAGMAFA